MENSFQIHKIKELGEVIGGGTPSTEKSEYWGGNVPWISPVDLSIEHNVFVASGAKNITAEGLKKSGAKMLPRNTVLLTSRAPIGYVAIAKNPISTNQGFKSIICNEEKIDFLFLYYYLFYNKEYLECFASGSTFPELSASRLKGIKLKIPNDIQVQQKIGKFLFS